MSIFSIFSFRPERKISDFEAYIALEEVCTDELEITQHNVQRGSDITDNAYKKPSLLRIDLASSPFTDPLNVTYEKLLTLQSELIPMSVVTGKRTYQNMLIKSLVLTNNLNTENIVFASLDLEEIKVVDVQTVNVNLKRNNKLLSGDKKKQKNPKKTTPTATAPKKKTETANKQQTSAIQNLYEIFK